MKPLKLSPAQQQGYNRLKHAISGYNLLGFVSRPGAGSTTILKQLSLEINGRVVALPELLDHTTKLHPLHLEESLLATYQKAWQETEILIIDDFSIITQLLYT